MTDVMTDVTPSVAAAANRLLDALNEEVCTSRPVGEASEVLDAVLVAAGLRDTVDEIVREAADRVHEQWTRAGWPEPAEGRA